MKHAQPSTRKDLRRRRHVRVRGKIRGTTVRPRLFVFRSNQHVYASIIDDEQGKTLASVSDANIPSRKGQKPLQQAREIGKALAAKAKTKKISRVVFDRGGYQYHGIVQALAEAAREGGLIF